MNSKAFEMSNRSVTVKMVCCTSCVLPWFNNY